MQVTPIWQGSSLKWYGAGMTDYKYRVRIEKSYGYRGYFWYSEYTHEKLDHWRSFRSGYAITFLGAKWIANRKIDKYNKFKGGTNEWVFERESVIP